MTEIKPAMVTAPWPKNPLIYEIQTWPWLCVLSQNAPEPITLKNIPDAELDALASWGFDAIWLMGAWRRSPAGREIALDYPDLQEVYRRALPDCQPDDVVGSPFSIYSYEVDARLGGREGLAALRERLARRGLRLLLDFVPNHVSVDNPWLESHPEMFIEVPPEEAQARPDYYFEVTRGGQHHYYANGRDPYFPAWTDTAQLNAFSPVVRARLIDTLLDIAAQCDGVRCDMAMLVTHKAFVRTWGERAGQVPAHEFWEVVIPAIKGQYPHMMFMAEVYWDMEWDLQHQGFDFTYDKRLYDRLRNEPVRAILAHLYADPAFQERMVRFIENHDEPRAVAALGVGRARAAAVLVTTLPGATLLHEGQLGEWQIKQPVQLGRRVMEMSSAQSEAFYRLLMSEACHVVYHEGAWRLRDCIPAWDLNASHRNLIAYSWLHQDERRVIVVNYTATSSQGRVPLPDFGLAGHKWRLRDTMTGKEYDRDGGDMNDNGLYVDLMPWQAHVFAFAPMEDQRPT